MTNASADSSGWCPHRRRPSSASVPPTLPRKETLSAATGFCPVSPWLSSLHHLLRVPVRLSFTSPLLLAGMRSQWDACVPGDVLRWNLTKMNTWNAELRGEDKGENQRKWLAVPRRVKNFVLLRERLKENAELLPLHMVWFKSYSWFVWVFISIPVPRHFHRSGTSTVSSAVLCENFKKFVLCESNRWQSEIQSVCLSLKTSWAQSGRACARCWRRAGLGCHGSGAAQGPAVRRWVAQSGPSGQLASEGLPWGLAVIWHTQGVSRPGGEQDSCGGEAVLGTPSEKRSCKAMSKLLMPNPRFWARARLCCASHLVLGPQASPNYWVSRELQALS